MRVLMFGRGVIATIYGRTFQAGGHDVEYYVRPGRAAEYGDEVRVDLIDGRRGLLGTRIRETVRTTLRESFAAEDGFDLVVISVGHHRLTEAAEFVAPRLGDATVLVLGNIWDEPLLAIAPLPAERVVFGFPMAGGGFDADGMLHGALLPSVVIGAAPVPPSRRELEVHALFRRAGLAVRIEKDMPGWLWLHFVADAGMFAQAIRSGGMPKMIGDRRALRDAFLTSRELLPLLEARGVDLRQHRLSMLPLRMPGLVGTTLAWVTRLVPMLRVSLAAHPDPHGVEPSAVLDDTRREARRRGIPTPRLDA